jgi:hypothetical protein
MGLPLNDADADARDDDDDDDDDDGGDGVATSTAVRVAEEEDPQQCFVRQLRAVIDADAVTPEWIALAAAVGSSTSSTSSTGRSARHQQQLHSMLCRMYARRVVRRWQQYCRDVEQQQQQRNLPVAAPAAAPAVSVFGGDCDPHTAVTYLLAGGCVREAVTVYLDVGWSGDAIALAATRLLVSSSAVDPWLLSLVTELAQHHQRQRRYQWAAACWLTARQPARAVHALLQDPTATARARAKVRQQASSPSSSPLSSPSAVDTEMTAAVHGRLLLAAQLAEAVGDTATAQSLYERYFAAS